MEDDVEAPAPLCPHDPANQALRLWRSGWYFALWGTQPSHPPKFHQRQRRRRARPHSSPPPEERVLPPQWGVADQRRLRRAYSMAAATSTQPHITQPDLTCPATLPLFRFRRQGIAAVAVTGRKNRTPQPEVVQEEAPPSASRLHRRWRQV